MCLEYLVDFEPGEVGYKVLRGNNTQITKFPIVFDHWMKDENNNQSTECGSLSTRPASMSGRH